MTERLTASEREALVTRMRDDLGKAIGGLPLPWGKRELDAPLARVADAIDSLCAEVERLTRELDEATRAINAAYAALTENVYGTPNQLEYVERILAEARARTTGGRDA